MAKSLSRNFSVYMLKNLVSIAVPLITIPYASRALGPSGIGDVQYVQSWISYFSLIAGLGISSYAVREGSKLRDEYEKLQSFSSEIIEISVLSTAVAYVALWIFLRTVENLRPYTFLFVVCSLLVAATGLNTEWICTIFEDYDYISKRSILFQLASVVILFLLVKQRNDTIQYAVVLVMPTAAACILNWIYGKRKLCWKFRFGPNAIKKHIKPIICIFGVGIASTIYTSLDSTMLGYIIGTDAVGIYTVASRLSKSVLSLINASCVVFLPRLSYYAGTNKSKFNDLSARVINVLLLLAIPCAMGLFTLSREFIIIFSGNEFEAATVPMQILSANIFFSALDGFLAWQILIPMNREKKLLIATIVGMSVDGVLNALLIKNYGVVGASIATLLAEVCVCVISIFSCRDLLQFKPMIKNIFQCFLATIPFLLIHRLCVVINYSRMVCVLLAIFLSCIAYIVALSLLKNESFFDLTREIKKQLETKMMKVQK